MFDLKVLEGVLNDVGFNPTKTYLNKSHMIKSFSKNYKDSRGLDDATIITIWIENDTNKISSFFQRKSLYSSTLIVDSRENFYKEHKYVFRKHKLLNLV